MTMNATSSDDRRSESPSADSNDSRPAKKRKLRPPGEVFQVNGGPADNPQLHQGRSRAIPHKEGQWSTHIYLEPAATSALVKTLEAAIDKVSQVSLKEYNIAAHSMLDKQGRKVVNLHLSLSRPIQLWTGQRGDFIAACRRALLDTNGFDFSCASFDVLTNDERTRSFLVCEVGYGHDHLASLTAVFNEVLEKKHLPKYYAEPRFHISIAWWLHEDAKALPAGTLEELNKTLGAELRKQVMKADQIHLKIGKDVTAIDLL